MNPKRRHRQPAEEAPDSEVDFLTPEQRLDAIAEILATIALRIVREEQAKEQDENAKPPEAEEKLKRSGMRRKKPPQ